MSVITDQSHTCTACFKHCPYYTSAYTGSTEKNKPFAEGYIIRAEIQYGFVSFLVINASQKALRFWNVIGIVCLPECRDRPTAGIQIKVRSWLKRMLHWFHSSLRKHWRQGSHWACAYAHVCEGENMAQQSKQVLIVKMKNDNPNPSLNKKLI